MRSGMVEFVRDFFSSHDPLGTELYHKYPFRKRFDHCFRCSVWARRIAQEEQGDIEVAETAALFHDIGKGVSRPDQNHGAVGAEICDEYLRSIGYDRDKSIAIAGIVANHSQHASSAQGTLEARIVSDADLLDEIGAIAILWDAMACALGPDPSYEAAYERSLRMTVPLKDSVPQRLHTSAAKKMAQERFQLVESFLKNLQYELGLAELWHGPQQWQRIGPG
jgi:uncharacterized protein